MPSGRGSVVASSHPRFLRRPVFATRRGRRSWLFLACWTRRQSPNTHGRVRKPGGLGTHQPRHGGNCLPTALRMTAAHPLGLAQRRTRGQGCGGCSPCPMSATAMTEEGDLAAAISLGPTPIPPKPKPSPWTKPKHRVLRDGMIPDGLGQRTATEAQPTRSSYLRQRLRSIQAACFPTGLSRCDPSHSQNPS